MALIRTPFHDAIGPQSVPRRGSRGGLYDHEPGVDLPDRTPSPDGVPELHRDDSPGKPPGFVETGKNLKNILGG